MSITYLELVEGIKEIHLVNDIMKNVKDYKRCIVINNLILAKMEEKQTYQRQKDNLDERMDMTNNGEVYGDLVYREMLLNKKIINKLGEICELIEERKKLRGY